MSTATLFLLFVIGITLAALAVFLIKNKINPLGYFDADTGLGIAYGIGTVLLLCAVVWGLSGCSGRYLNDVSVFAGLDYTKNPSPMCKPGPDDRTTSNLGARVNVWRSDDKRLNVNGKYTHHSCAFNADRFSYDAAGVEIDYKVWAR